MKINRIIFVLLIIISGCIYNEEPRPSHFDPESPYYIDISPADYQFEVSVNGASVDVDFLWSGLKEKGFVNVMIYVVNGDNEVYSSNSTPFSNDVDVTIPLLYPGNFEVVAVLPIDNNEKDNYNEQYLTLRSDPFTSPLPVEWGEIPIDTFVQNIEVKKYGGSIDVIVDLQNMELIQADFYDLKFANLRKMEEYSGYTTSGVECFSIKKPGNGEHTFNVVLDNDNPLFADDLGKLIFGLTLKDDDYVIDCYDDVTHRNSSSNIFNGFEIFMNSNNTENIEFEY